MSVDSLDMLALERMNLLASEDPAKRDLEIICQDCRVHLCDVEDADTVRTLVEVALGHHCTEQALLRVKLIDDALSATTWFDPTDDQVHAWAVLIAKATHEGDQGDVGDVASELSERLYALIHDNGETS